MTPPAKPPEPPSSRTPAARTPAPRPVFARHAASLLVVRQGAAGPELLMGIRAGGHRFMPNALVFPGGAVDPIDASAPVASEPSQSLLAALARNARPRLARAIAVAAARELQEETGLSLGTPPRLEALAYLCRAVTPPSSPIRFNARFLLAPAEATQGTPTDSRELTNVRYRPLEEILRADLMLVTREVLLRFHIHQQSPAPHPQQVFKGRRWQPE